MHLLLHLLLGQACLGFCACLRHPSFQRGVLNLVLHNLSSMSQPSPLIQMLTTVFHDLADHIYVELCLFVSLGMESFSHS